MRPDICIWSKASVLQMDDSSYITYRRNFDPDKKERNDHSCNDHLKINKIAKFRCELL